MCFSKSQISDEDDDSSDEDELIGLVNDWISENSHLFQNSDGKKRKRKRRRKKRINYWDTEWGRLMLDPSTMDAR